VDFEWDRAKSARNAAERGLPFALAALLFDGPVLERIDARRDFGELRVRAIGRVGEAVLHCVYTDRGDVRRIISLRRANRKERDAYRATFEG
jgi:uncharacterized DUF497 family protein